MAESSKKISVNVKTPKDKQTFEIDEDAEVTAVSFSIFHTKYSIRRTTKKNYDEICKFSMTIHIENRNTSQ